MLYRIRFLYISFHVLIQRSKRSFQHSPSTIQGRWYSSYLKTSNSGSDTGCLTCTAKWCTSRRGAAGCPITTMSSLPCLFEMQQHSCWRNVHPWQEIFFFHLQQLQAFPLCAGAKPDLSHSTNTWSVRNIKCIYVRQTAPVVVLVCRSTSSYRCLRFRD